MRKIILTLCILATLTATSFASPAVGEVVVIRTSSTRYAPALVTKVVSGDTVNLVAVIDSTADWPDPVNMDYMHPAWLYTSVDKGTDVGEWQESTIPAPVTDAIEVEVDGRLANPGAPVSAGLTLDGAGVQFSATRPVRLNVRLTASMTSTLLGPQSYTAELRCDSGSTPTTVVDAATGGLSGVVATTDQPVKLSALVPTGHYCRAVTAAASANTTLTLTASTKQVL